MYQPSKSSSLTLDKVSRILITTDEVSNLCDFTFIKSSAHWLQVYLDVGVLFIIKLEVEENIDEHLADMSQFISFDIRLHDREPLDLIYSLPESKVVLKTSMKNLEFIINNDSFTLIK